MPETVDDILSRIATDRNEGAASLALRGLDALEALAPSLPPEPAAAHRELARLAARIDSLRPSMGAIGAQAVLAVTRARGLTAEGMSPAAAVIEAVCRERESLGRANTAIADLARRELAERGTLVTCSRSMTVQQCLVALRPDLVSIGEGHPLDDGRSAARWLSARGLIVEVVPDGALPGLVRGAKAVIVGADQMLSGGGLINRSSTLPLALAARHFGVPFFVACQRIKLAGAVSAEIEEAGDRTPDAAGGSRGRVPLFEVTPPELIDGVLTEVGRLTATEAGALGAGLAALRAGIAAEAGRQ